MAINFMDSVMDVWSMTVGAAGLELLGSVVVCIGMVKVLQVTYHIIKEGYDEKHGKAIVGTGFAVGIVKLLPYVFELIQTGFGV